MRTELKQTRRAKAKSKRNDDRSYGWVGTVTAPAQHSTLYGVCGMARSCCCFFFAPPPHPFFIDLFFFLGPFLFPG
jgi:hypothetical protein